MAVAPIPAYGKDIRRHGNNRNPPIPPLDLCPNPPPVYPSAYFAAVHDKPSIAVRNYVGDFAAFETHVYNTIVNKTVTVDEAVTYLWYVMGKITGTLDADWISFDVKIGDQGQEITAQSTLRHLVQDGGPHQVRTGGASHKDDWELMTFYLLSPYRLTGALRQDYKSVLARRYINIANGGKSIDGQCSIIDFTSTRGSWDQDADYSKAVAGLDMFLSRFPNNKHAKLRIGSIISRLRDCMGLSNLGTLAGLIQTEIKLSLQWIWCPKVADDIDRLTKVGEEIDIHRSYMQYYAAMKLGNKSPYSATVNSALHIFTHTVGCIIGKDRSINAKMVSSDSLMDAVLNGFLVGYAVMTRRTTEAQFYEPGDAKFARREVQGAVLGSDDEDDGEAAAVEAAQKKEPYTKEPGDWYTYYGQFGCKMPPHVMIVVYNRLRNIPNPREGTVGAYLQKMGADNCR